MKIADGKQKAVLSALFYDKVGQTSEGQPTHQPKQFPFAKLMDAAGAAKKLAEGSVQKDGMKFYNNDEIELTLDETIIISELFDANADNWDVTVADTVMELQELLHGDEDKPSKKQ